MFRVSLPAAASDAPLSGRYVFEQLAARVLSRFSLGMGAIVVAVSLLQRLAVSQAAAPLTLARLGFGLGVLGGGALGWLLLERGLARGASQTVLGVALLAIGSHAALTGLGMHSLILASN